MSPNGEFILVRELDDTVKIVKNNGKFDFSNYIFVKILETPDKMQEWEHIDRLKKTC